MTIIQFHVMPASVIPSDSNNPRRMTKGPLFHPVPQWIVNAKFMPQETSVLTLSAPLLTDADAEVEACLRIAGGCRDGWISGNPQAKGATSGSLRDPD